MKLFALNSSLDFGQSVASELQLPLSKHEEVDFEDGEHACRPLESVRNEDVFVIQSLYADATLSVNDKLCRLLFFIGALKDAAARSVTAVLPYLCYARKDQKSERRGPVTTRYIATLLETVGVDHVVTIDVHDVPAYQNAFRIPTENLEAQKLFLDHLAGLALQENLVIMSPDIVGAKRAERFQKAVSKRMQQEIPIAFKEKYRTLSGVTGDTIIGDVAGKTVFIIDDMISTGTTIARAAAACKEAGATRVIAAVTHGLFSSKAGDVLSQQHLDQIFITNTIPSFRLQGHGVLKKITVLDVAPLFAATIKNMNEGGSVTALLET